VDEVRIGAYQLQRFITEARGLARKKDRRRGRHHARYEEEAAPDAEDDES